MFINIIKNIYEKVIRAINLFKRLNNDSALSADLFKDDFKKALTVWDVDKNALKDVFKKHSIYDLWVFYVSSINGPHYRMSWGEEKMTKLPMDVWIYKNVISDAKPNLLIEIGTQRGGSALLLKELCRESDVIVVTIDISPPSKSMIDKFEKNGVISLNINVEDSDLCERIMEVSGLELSNVNAMIIDDGLHSYEHVTSTFGKLNKLIKSGGYYIVEDGFTNFLIDKNSHDAMSAVRDITSSYDEFYRYDDYDDFIFSTTFMGILRKK
jgi:cephalosporin hydroxylase